MKEFYPPVGFYFKVIVEGESYNFKEVSGISAELDTTEVTEGGENRFKYKVPTSVKYNDLVLKRGLIPENSKLLVWLISTFETNLNKKIEQKSIQVNLVDENGKSLATWDFVNAWPVKCNIGNLSAMNNEVLVESISLSYSYFNTRPSQ